MIVVGIAWRDIGIGPRQIGGGRIVVIVEQRFEPGQRFVGEPFGIVCRPADFARWIAARQLPVCQRGDSTELDTGKGACELIWVDQLKIVTPLPL